MEKKNNNEMLSAKYVAPTSKVVEFKIKLSVCQALSGRASDYWTDGSDDVNNYGDNLL